MNNNQFSRIMTLLLHLSLLALQIVRFLSDRGIILQVLMYINVCVSLGLILHRRFIMYTFLISFVIFTESSLLISPTKSSCIFVLILYARSDPDTKIDFVQRILVILYSGIRGSI